MSQVTVAEMQHPAEILSIPVRYDPRARGIAFARGVWPLKSIVVGIGWFHLSAGEQQAALAHEVGHCRGFHLELRLLLLPFYWCEWAQAIARRQEFDADAFAVRSGQGAGMLQLMLRACAVDRARARQAEAPTLDQIIERKMSPSASERLRRISHLLQEGRHEVAV